MPTQLYKNEAVSFVCARNFTYAGTDYAIGEDFPQEEAVGRLELLVRTRRVIPVVDSYEDKPRHWHREVRLRSDVENRLGVSPSVRTQLDQTPAQHDDQSDLEFNPAEHDIDGVLDYVDENPDEVLSVYVLEEQGKNRKTLLTKLDVILNKQADDENKENTDV